MPRFRLQGCDGLLFAEVTGLELPVHCVSVKLNQVPRPALQNRALYKNPSLALPRGRPFGIPELRLGEVHVDFLKPE